MITKEEEEQHAQKCLKMLIQTFDELCATADDGDIGSIAMAIYLSGHLDLYVQNRLKQLNGENQNDNTINNNGNQAYTN